MSIARRLVVINAIDIRASVPEHVRPPCCGALASVVATAVPIVEARRIARRRLADARRGVRGRSRGWESTTAVVVFAKDGVWE